MNELSTLDAALSAWLRDEPVGRVRPEVVRSAIAGARMLPQRPARRGLAWPAWSGRRSRIGRPVAVGACAVGLVVILATGLQLRPVDRAVAPATSASPFPLAASVVPFPGKAPAEITLGTGRDRATVTGLTTSFRAGQPIEATVWQALPFDFSHIVLRWFRLGDALPMYIGSDSVDVDRTATLAELSLTPHDPGRYRIVAYTGMTVPMASVDVEVVDGEPVSVPPVAPPLPRDWSVIQSGSRDLRLALPPGINPFDISGAILANQAPGADGGFVQLLAEGPAADGQPAAGASLADWVVARYLSGATLIAQPTIRAVRLPAGDAIEVRARVRGDTERLAVLLAIRAPGGGVGSLMIDGPADRMALLAPDLDLVPRLVELLPVAVPSGSPDPGVAVLATVPPVAVETPAVTTAPIPSPDRTSVAPASVARPPALITLATGRGEHDLAGLSSLFAPGVPIEGTVWQGTAFDADTLVVHLSPTTPAGGSDLEPPGWEVEIAVDRIATSARFTLPALEPGTYRLTARIGDATPFAATDVVVRDGVTTPVLPERPPRPEGWMALESGAGDLRVLLPPGWSVGGASGPISAATASATDPRFLQLYAEGPRTAEPQPAADASLEQWLIDRWMRGETMTATSFQVLLPAGEATGWWARMVLGPDEVQEYLILAIRTPTGVAFLDIDGSESLMRERLPELLAIATQLQIPAAPG